MEHFSYIGECGVRGCTFMKAFIRVGLGDREMALVHNVVYNSRTTKECLK